MPNLSVFILLLFLIAVLFRVDFFFYVLYVFFGVMVVSRLWTSRALNAISVEREYPSRAFLGDQPIVRLRVRNSGWLPLPWLRVRESLPIQLKVPNRYQCVLSLLSHENQTLSYELDCRRRGYYHLGPLRLEAGDLFGLQKRERRLDEEDALTVYPRVVPIADLGLPSQTPFGDILSKERIFQDPARMVGVRDYQSGDSIRHIHWKATALKGNLQVKRFEPAISVESQIFLNLNREDYTLSRAPIASELAIVTAASLATHLIERRQTAGLCCTGQDPLGPGRNVTVLPPRRGRDHLMQMLDVLARVEMADEGEPFADLLGQARMHLAWGGTVVIISPGADDQLFDRVILMKRSGFQVSLVVMDPQTPFVEIRRRADELGVATYQIWRERDLDVWR